MRKKIILYSRLGININKNVVHGRRNPNYSNCLTEQPAMIFIANKYTEYYNNIINRAKIRKLSTDVYTEEHHIIPKSFYTVCPAIIIGNPDDTANLVLLTAREHIFCHRMLTRMTTGAAYQKAQNAEFLMLHRKYPDGTIYRITSKEYAMLQQAHSLRISAQNKILWKDNTKRKDNQSIMMKDRWNDPAYKSTMQSMSKALWEDTNYKDLQTTIRKEQWVDINYRAVQSASRKKVWSDPLQKEKRTGVNHPRYDHTIYTFHHKDGQIELCTRHDLGKKYNIRSCGMSLLLSGYLKSTKGWKRV